MPPAPYMCPEAALFLRDVSPELAAALVKALDRACERASAKVHELFPSGFHAPLQGHLRRRYFIEELEKLAIRFGLRIEQRDYLGNIVDSSCPTLTFSVLFVGKLALIFHNATWEQLPQSDHIRTHFTRGPEMFPLFPFLDQPVPPGFPEDVTEVVTVCFEIDRADRSRSTIAHIDALVLDAGGTSVRAVACDDLRAYTRTAAVEVVDEPLPEPEAIVSSQAPAHQDLDGLEELPEPEVRLRPASPDDSSDS